MIENSKLNQTCLWMEILSVLWGSTASRSCWLVSTVCAHLKTFKIIIILFCVYCGHISPGSMKVVEVDQNSLYSFLLKSCQFVPASSIKHHKLVGLSVENITSTHRRHWEQLEIKQSSAQVMRSKSPFHLPKSLFTNRCPIDKARQKEPNTLTVPYNDTNWTRKGHFKVRTVWPSEGEWKYVLLY